MARGLVRQRLLFHMRYVTLNVPCPGAPQGDLRVELQAVTTAGYAALRIAEELGWPESQHRHLFVLTRGEWVRKADKHSLGEVADQYGEPLMVTVKSEFP